MNDRIFSKGELAATVRIVVFGLVAFALLAGSAMAQSSPHAAMRKSLVWLKAEGRGGEGGKFVGQDVDEEGTGVMISSDGLVLTTYHLIGALLDKEVDGQTVKISANIEEKSEFPRFGNVTIMNAAPLLDLLLLKIPPTSDPFIPAKIGSAADLKPEDTIYTSGFPHSANYTTQSGQVNSKDGPRGYLWTVTLPFLSGQSGSPVYDKDGRIVGIAKGNDERAENQNYMIPIQFADPLIAHMKLAALAGDLGKLETEIDPLRKQLQWSAHFSSDGREVLLSYNKLILGEPHVAKLRYNLYLTGGDITRYPAFPEMQEMDLDAKTTGDGQNFVLERAGTSVDRFRQDSHGKPAKEVLISIVPTLDSGEKLQPQTVAVEPAEPTS